MFINVTISVTITFTPHGVSTSFIPNFLQQYLIKLVKKADCYSIMGNQWHEEL